jgi:hypothetical protein
MLININTLHVSQLYLSNEKINGIKQWFSPDLKNFEPVPVRDFFNNGELVLTDGHTRAFVAYTNGLTEIPAVYDDDKIVTSKTGQEEYKNCILWCKRYNVNSISDYETRIISKELYTTLWTERCDKMHNLVNALQNNKIPKEEYNAKKRKLEEKYYIYGISDDLKTLYYENSFGELYEMKYTDI